MKRTDGGFRPTYNAPLATATVGGVIVGVGVSDRGADSGQMPKMVEQLKGRYGRTPAQGLYRERGAVAEWVNAGARNRGLYQVRVRGRRKVLAVLLWQALAHNLIRAASLQASRASGG